MSVFEDIKTGLNEAIDFEKQNKMNKKKIATIYDFRRLCETNYFSCASCPLSYDDGKCSITNHKYNIDAINRDIVKWCEEHPTKTRQSEFLKLFPNAKLDNTNILSMCPKDCDVNRFSFQKCRDMHSCGQCRKEFWLQEVE